MEEEAIESRWAAAAETGRPLEKVEERGKGPKEPV
jgi:hypothetical protein